MISPLTPGLGETLLTSRNLAWLPQAGIALDSTIGITRITACWSVPGHYNPSHALKNLAYDQEIPRYLGHDRGAVDHIG